MSSSLNCLQWMSSQEGQSPCTTAQEVGQLCNHTYTVSSGSFQESNYVPNATTADGCTCSWSIYNLVSACSYCVGQYQYASWNTWITNCGSYVSNTSYLPSGLTISQGIPFWAATNPFTWYNEVFNITQAADIAEQDQPDVTGGPLPTSTPTSSSSISIGETVGLLMGGISIIIIGALIVLCAVYRRRRRAMRTAPYTVPSFSQSVVVPPIHSQMPIQSALPVHVSAPLTPTHLVTDSADMISPFLVASSSRQTNQAHVSPLRRKAAEAESVRAMVTPGQRPRLNPPPYSDSVEPGASVSARRPSTRKERRRGSVSRAVTSSSYSRPSTMESMATGLGSARTQSLGGVVSPDAETAQSTESTVRGGGVASVDDGDP